MKKEILIKKEKLSKRTKDLIKNSFKNTPFSKIAEFYENLEKNKGITYCLYFKKEAVGIIQLLNKKESLEIETIAVKKEYQRKGFGTILVSFAVAEAKKRKKKFLEATTLKNYSVENFYLKKGFKKELKGYSIKFNKKDFDIVLKNSENFSLKKRMAFINEKQIKKLKDKKIKFKIINHYQTFIKKL